MLALLFMACLSPRAGAAADVSLPEVRGWECGEPRVISFDSVSGSQGFWWERDYRTPEGTRFKATLMGGKGPKYYNQPAHGIESDDGPFGSGGTYETIMVGGYRAVLETHPILGVSLAVNASDAGCVLTLEAGNWTPPGEIIGAAEILLPIAVKK
jgi:hypothetical protein